MNSERFFMQPAPEIDCPPIDEIRHASPFLARLRIADGQRNLVVNHVPNTEFVEWIDRIAELHSDWVGYTRPILASRGLMWFVARHEIDYRAEVWPGDELIAATWVGETRRVRSWREVVVYRPTDTAVVTAARTLWVLVDLETRRPMRIPDEMNRAFTDTDWRVLRQDNRTAPAAATAE